MWGRLELAEGRLTGSRLGARRVGPILSPKSPRADQPLLLERCCTRTVAPTKRDGDEEGKIQLLSLGPLYFSS